MAAPDFVQLVIIDPRSPQHGTVLDRWEKFTFVNDLFTPADYFHFSVRVGARADAVTAKQLAEARAAVGEETVVQLRVKDGTVLATGIIDDVFAGGDRGGMTLELAGRDCMGIFQDNMASQKLRFSNLSFPELLDKVAAPYRGKGIPFNVVASNDANRDVMTGRLRPLRKSVGNITARSANTSAGAVKLPNKKSKPDQVSADFVRYPITEARPHGGETEYAFLDRHARNLGVMMWTSTGGDLIVSRPNYDQDVLFRLQRKIKGAAGNNILSGGRRRNRGNSATAVKMLGHTSGRGSFKEQIQVVAQLGKIAKPTLAQITAVQQQARLDTLHTIQKFDVEAVSPTDWVWPRVRVIHDGNAKDSTRAAREARRALARHNVNIESLEYEVIDYAQNGIYFGPDTLAYVDDEWAGVKGVYYIIARTYNKTRAGTRVSLRLIPKGAYVLD